MSLIKVGQKVKYKIGRDKSLGEVVKVDNERGYATVRTRKGIALKLKVAKLSLAS